MEAGARKVLVRVAILVGAITTALAMTPGASAATFGQLGETWGKAGTGAGQFFKPGTFGVDPVSGDVYAGDMNSSGSNYRIQRFGKTGELEAAVEFSRKDAATSKLVKLVGFAVDSARQRIYALEACKAPVGTMACSGTVGPFVALRVHAFSTAGGKLESAGTLAMPSGEAELYEPTAIAVDPTNGDLVLLGEDGSATHKVVQRLSSSGVVGARFVDSEDKLRPRETALQGEARSLAVGPDGTTYALTGGQAFAATGASSTRAWELPEGLTEVLPVPGFAAEAGAEDWPLPTQTRNGEGFTIGPGIAISPDGSTLYWKETYPGTQTVPESNLIRGYSLAAGKTRVLYGGGTTRCLVLTSWAGIAATGEGANEELLAFDYGPEQASPPYGAKVVRFGQGGSGCPAPVAKFSVDGQEADGVVVGRGETVDLDASASELEVGGGGEESEAFPLEYVWDFGDGHQEAVKCVEVEGECPLPASPTASHAYATPGEYAVTLEIRLEAPIFGNPQPVRHSLKVQSPPATLSVFRSGTGSGSVSSSPAGIACGEACAFEFAGDQVVTLTPSAAEGSEFAGWSGACSGAGACQVTMDEARSVTARFDLEQGTPPPSEFPLNVLLTGSGSGSVASLPLGISCGSVCGGQFQTGGTVTLTPTAAAGSEFAGWSGACSGTGACQVTMDEARSVGASFEPEPPPPPPTFLLTVVKVGSGAGTVASSRSGIYCGGKCEREYEEGEKVTLVPTAAAGSRFVGWSGGGCAGIGVCRLTMDVARTVTAGFEPLPVPPAQAPPVSAPAPTPTAVAPVAPTKHGSGRKPAKHGGRGKNRNRCRRVAAKHGHTRAARRCAKSKGARKGKRGRLQSGRS